MSALDDMALALRSKGRRIANLYSIKDKWGSAGHFRANSSQEWFRRERHLFTILGKSRQHGFSTEEAIQSADECIFRPDYNVGLIDKSLRDAKEKLLKVLFAYDTIGLNAPGLSQAEALKLNHMIHEAFPLVKRNEEELRWANGSSFRVSTGYRGGTLQRLWCSEFGYIAVHRPKDAQEIIAGAIPAVAAGNTALLEFTWEGGKAGEAWKLTEEALTRVGKEHLPREWKFLFIPFTQNPDNVLDVQEFRFRPEEERVFDRWAKQGVVPTLQQKAFWANEYRNLPMFSVFKHYPCVMEDMFLSPIEGAIYAEILTRRETNGFVHDFNVETRYPSYVCWDLGGANTAMWHVQVTPTEVRWLDFYQAPPPVDLAECVRMVEHWDSICPVVRNLLPHDADGTEKDGSTFKRELIRAGGRNVVVVPQCRSVWQGIGELNSVFEISRFHSNVKRKQRIGSREFTAWDLLLGYRVEQKPEGSTLPQAPKADHCCHAADAARYFAEARMQGLLGYHHGERRHHKDPGAILIGH